MRLPKNQYSDLTNAYGDVFVFTLGRYRKFEHGWATYGPMRDFAESIDRVNAVGWSREEMLRDAVLEENRSRETMFGRDRVLREVVSADDVWEKDVGKNLMLLDWLEKLIRDVGA